GAAATIGIQTATFIIKPYMPQDFFEAPNKALPLQFIILGEWQRGFPVRREHQIQPIRSDTRLWRVLGADCLQSGSTAPESISFQTSVTPKRRLSVVGRRGA